MKTMSYIAIIGQALTYAALVLALVASPAQAQSDVRSRIAAASEESPPRLFFDEQELARVQRTAEDPALQKLYEIVAAGADEAHRADLVERELEGRRLLGVSRDALQRVTYLAFMYRLTGERQYAERAEAQMLAAARFENWNPDHFLDVAEMTAALAIGYDWLYDEISADARRTIRDAIIEKGLQASFAQEWGWITEDSNWNQVCHGGLVLGALAVMDDAPELAARVIERAVERVRIPMEHYGPNGGYFEGPSYWWYGTHYNVLMIDALESVLGTDFGLTAIEPFMSSPDFYLHAHTPTLRLYNFSDSSIDPDIAPAMYWFAQRLDRPELLWMEKRKLKRALSGSEVPDGRLLPMLLVWADAEQMHADAQPDGLHFHAPDRLAVGMHRTGWDEQALFVGIEGSRADGHHAHLDAGSFVMEGDGVRWALDLKRPDYHPIEEAGLNLWDYGTDSDRWTIYRLNNFSHNTLVVNGRLQRPEGFASLVKHDGEGEHPHTVLDLSAVYDGQLASAQRGVSVFNERTVLVQDEIAASGQESAEVRWAMMTEAEVRSTGARTVTLSQDGKTLHFRIMEPKDARVEVYSTEPPAEYEPSNAGARLIGFTTTLDAGTEARLVITLTPGTTDDSVLEITPLAEW